MRFYLSSYYRWNTDVFYLSGFHIKSGRAVLHWHPCARQEVDPASPDETFLKNTYTACPERIELPKDALGQLVWLHTPCLSCRYFWQYNPNLLLQGSLSPELLSPEEESMYIQTQCRLRYLVIEEPSETFAAMEEARRLHATFEYNPRSVCPLRIPDHGAAGLSPPRPAGPPARAVCTSGTYAVQGIRQRVGADRLSRLFACAGLHVQHLTPFGNSQISSASGSRAMDFRGLYVLRSHLYSGSVRQ